MKDYPVKIWVLFGEAVSGNKEFNQWLLKNGYPELSALDHSIKVSDKAFEWLMKNSFPYFAAFSRAIYDEKEAYEWLKKHNFTLLCKMTEAINGDEKVLAWLKKDYPVFFILAQKIIMVRDQRLRDISDYHKMKN